MMMKRTGTFSSRQLRRIGFEVTAAKSGHDALRLLEARPFDLALVDFMMPGMDGLDVLEAIKENPQSVIVRL
jgi:CheY-like chemotaxis protein